MSIVEIAVEPRLRPVQRPQAGAQLLGEDTVPKALCCSHLVLVAGPDGLQDRARSRRGQNDGRVEEASRPAGTGSERIRQLVHEPILQLRRDSHVEHA